MGRTGDTSVGGMSRKMHRESQSSLIKAFCSVALSFVVAAAMSHAAEGPGANALATVPVVELPQGPIYWHLDTYRTRAEADALRGPRSTVVEAFAKVWLFTIAEAGWRPAGGVRVATIGPLRVRPEGRYTASYMQAATSPGFQTDVHQHGGPEALFTLSGEVCVETPGGKLVGRVGGEPLLIDGDIPMQLTSVGSDVRRSLVLILHDSGQPWKVPSTSSWTPKGLCVRPNG
jgi:quercetin dioxygenase-like cupin family protein